MPHFSVVIIVLALCAATGCASTTTSLFFPAPQSPVCHRSSDATIFWTTQWRPDQKNRVAREGAAAGGIKQFFETSGCFESVSVRRLADNSKETIADAVAYALARSTKVIVIVVRELGPTVKIGASLALVEGGTEVTFDVSEHMRTRPEPRMYAVQWRNGGPGIVKGVSALPEDMQAALAAGLQSATR